MKKYRIATNMLIFLLIAMDEDKVATKEDFKNFIRIIIEVLNE